MALMLLELRFEALEQREGVGCRAGESRQHIVMIDPAHLARGRLDDNVAERHLAVAAERHGAVAAHRKYRGAVKDFPWGDVGPDSKSQWRRDRPARVALARSDYTDFLTKCRGEIPINSKSARMIGDAPTICTVLRCVSTRPIALSSAPAQTKSIRSTSFISTTIRSRRWEKSDSACRSGAFGPTSKPTQGKVSASAPRLPAVVA